MKYKHLVLAIIGALTAIWVYGLDGLPLGVALGLLVAEVLKLRKRVETLEVSLIGDRPAGRATDNAVADDEPEIVFDPDPGFPDWQQSAGAPGLAEDGGSPGSTPQKEEYQPKEEGQTALDRFFASLGHTAGSLGGTISRFFTGGNLVLKIGILILFCGVAFLLKYAAQRNMLPPELRLIGAALAGMAMLAIGWRLRLRQTGYGLTMQGGGVGILYLTVFGAAKLYSFLPFPLALGLMVGLVALSCALAVLQDAKSLAVFGIVGGFLAPILMSQGGGNHVVLFSYYALLNGGIFGIAWFRSWRELNLIGFFFTFAIGTLWGSSGYRPEHFATTEPFLILFFLFYLCISVLYGHRQPVNLRGYIDGPLVFGLPLVASGLQYYLVRDFTYGMAFSALGLGFIYLLLATVLWRRLLDSMHLICEAFLALGVVFASLAIPLALDGHWSASIWALEGAGMVWIGMRQQRVLARHFGILLQLAAAYIFIDSVWYPFGALPFANRYFLGCLFLALAALISSYWLDSNRQVLKKWETYFPLPLLVIGLIWWYIGGLREVDRQIASMEEANGFLLYSCVSTIIFARAARMLAWERINLALLLQLPVMILLATFGILGMSRHDHLFGGWGAPAWIIAFVVVYRVLYEFSDAWRQWVRHWWHLGSFWLLLLVASHEAAWGVGWFTASQDVWAYICWVLVPSLGIMALIHLGKGASWPVGKYRDMYLGAGPVAPALFIIGWLLVSFTLPGDPAPLPYIPLVSPIELFGLVAIGVLLLWHNTSRSEFRSGRRFPVQFILIVPPLLLFLLINSVVARCVHFYVGIPYSTESLYHSVIFQAAIAALWGFGALAITVWAARHGSRAVWGVGAGLLAMTVAKLFIVDLSGTGTVARIVSFLVVGVLMLIIGYFSPLPPKPDEAQK